VFIQISEKQKLSCQLIWKRHFQADPPGHGQLCCQARWVADPGSYCSIRPQVLCGSRRREVLRRSPSMAISGQYWVIYAFQSSSLKALLASEGGAED